MTSSELATNRFAFHLVGDKTLEGEQFVTNFFNSLFDIKKLVLVKQSHKDKHLIKEVVIILNSQNNIEMLSGGNLQILDTKFASSEIPVDEAEQLIRQNKTKLYVGNIPRGVDNIKLWKHFARFGTLDYTYIIKKPDRNSRGFGFIIYEERESFERAVKAKHYIDGQRLICKLFLNKSQLTKHGKADSKHPDAGSEALEADLNDQGTALEASESGFIQQTMLDCLDDEQVCAPVKSSDSLPGKISTTTSSDQSKKHQSTVDQEEQVLQHKSNNLGQHAARDYPTPQGFLDQAGYYGMQNQGYYQEDWAYYSQQPEWPHYGKVYQTPVLNPMGQACSFQMSYPEGSYQNHYQNDQYSPQLQRPVYQQIGFGRPTASSCQQSGYSARGIQQPREAWQDPRAVGNRRALPVPHMPTNCNFDRRMPVQDACLAQPNHQRGARTTPGSAAPAWPQAVRPTRFVAPTGAHW